MQSKKLEGRAESPSAPDEGESGLDSTFELFFARELLLVPSFSVSLSLAHVRPEPLVFREDKAELSVTTVSLTTVSFDEVSDVGETFAAAARI